MFDLQAHHKNGGEFGIEMSERECAEWIFERLEGYAHDVIDILCELRDNADYKEND